MNNHVWNVVTRADDEPAEDRLSTSHASDEEIAPRLALEESVLFSELRRLGEGAMVDRALAEHVFLREQAFATRAGDPSAADAFAERLTEYIRFVDRVLLPRCDELFSKPVLDPRVDVLRRAT